MNCSIHLTTAIQRAANLMCRSPLRRGFLLVALPLVWFALSPLAQAQDGGLPNFNTAEGDFALSSLTTGNRNSALGYAALFKNTSGDSNTATGYQALFSNAGGQQPATGAFALQILAEKVSSKAEQL